VEWSYRLLNEPEQRLLRRLALFAGTFDLAAVEAVCADTELPVVELADVLRGLVDKSLVTVHRHPDGGLRYALMEAIRQYGQERLLEASESRLRALHAGHYARLVDRLETGPDLRDRVDRVAAEYDNVRLALEWAADQDPDLEAVLISKLDWFWRVRGSVREARDQVLSALDKEHPPARQARLHVIAGRWLRLAGELEAAVAQVDEAMRLLSRLDDPLLAARIIGSRAVVRQLTGDLAGAEEDYSQALGRLRGLPPNEELVRLLNDLAMLRLAAGRPEEALTPVERSIQVLAQLSDRFVFLPEVCHTHGAALLLLQRTHEAKERFLEGLEQAAECASNGTAVAVLQGLACCAAESGDPGTCLELLAAARNRAQVAGLKGFVAPATPAVAAEQTSRAALGEQAASRAWERGFGMDLETALERARAGQPNLPSTRVTPRKMAVVRLVAQGLGNKEIAQRMSISERTVEAHLEQVRNQLGFHNRAQIVAWAISNGLVPTNSSA
jgi:non-specific serine/threonine protein kinase